MPSLARLWRPLGAASSFSFVLIGLSTATWAQEGAESPVPPPEAAPLPPAPKPFTIRPAVSAQDMPSMGPISYGMERFDTLVPQFMEKWDIPGASIAIVRGERLVFARSYGLANVETGEKMQPQSRFRLASISKVITATAVLQLIDEGKLHLDDRVLDILSDLKPLPGQSLDPRVSQITIQHLLQHTAGWERFVAPDITYIDASVARATGLPYPVSKSDAIRYLIAQPLQHDPGTQHSYCNFGYALLGEIIEKVTGQEYESYVRSHVLAPAGVRGIRLGHTLMKDRASQEVNYYTYRDARLARSVYDGKTIGPRSDVGFSMENIAACGGWIGSAPDLARFMVAIDGKPRRRDVLSPAMHALREVRPQLVDAPKTTKAEGEETTTTGQAETETSLPAYYGNGVRVKVWPEQTNYWHSGSLSGTATLMRWATSGLGWVVLMNGRPRDPDFDGDLSAMIFNGVKEVKQWPKGDLFELFKPEYKD